VIRELKRFGMVVVLAHLGAVAALAQPGETRETQLARGWTRLAAGQPAEAATIAERLLAKTPRDHDALSLAMTARVAQQRALAALDAYETWLKASRAEDVFLLEHVARGTLDEIARGADRGLSIRALEVLARAGVAGARERLGAARPSAPPAGQRTEVYVDALQAAGAASVPALRDAIREERGPVRAAAVRALGALDARDTVEEVRALLTDQDPLVRTTAAVTLARFGDADGEARVQQMLQSPVADMRLLAAEAYQGRGTGPWVSAITPLLDDPNGVTRLRAAELLAPVNPTAARAVLETAAGDPNPVVRSEAARILSSAEAGLVTATDLPILRRMLRDPDAGVRLQGAAGVLALLVSR
jgi:HEAT repeat protein